MTKKILVTGSNGYIGQHLVKYLQLKGYYTIGLDRVDNGVNIGDEFIHQNILDTYPIEIDELDTVIHLAALVQVSGGQKDMMDYYRTNVVGTMNMLERVDYKNFIFASTCQTYAGHVYGTTKNIAEMIIRQYCELNNKPVSIFRFGNVVGSAGFKPTNPDGLLYNLIKAKETGTFYLYGDDYQTVDGSAERDYLHVMEVCYALEKAIDHPSRVPGAEVQPMYEYLGHGEEFTVLQCVQAFKKANKCDFNVVVKPRREGDPYNFLSPGTHSPYMPPNISTLEGMMKE